MAEGGEPAKPATNMQEIIAQARSFLQSPQVQSHDLPAKRKFLLDKGLPPTEVDRLLAELVSVLRAYIFIAYC